MNHDDDKRENIFDDINDEDNVIDNPQGENFDLEDDVEKNVMNSNRNFFLNNKKNKKENNIKNLIKKPNQETQAFKDKIGALKNRNVFNNMKNTMINSFQKKESNKEIANEEARKTALGGIAAQESIEKIKKSQASPELKKQLGNIIIQKILTKKIIMIGSLTGLLVVVLIIFMSVILTSVEDDRSEVNTSKEILGLIDGTLDFNDITGYLVNLGICKEMSDKDLEKKSCEASSFGKFLFYFKSIYENYQTKLDKYDNPIKLDIPLLLETISYNRNDNTLIEILTLEDQKVTSGSLTKNAIYTELDDLADALVEQASEYGDLYTCSGTVKDNACSSCTTKKDQLYKTYYRISDEKFVSYLKYGKVHENYFNKLKIYDVDVHPDSDSTCIPEGKYYNPPSDIRYQGTIVDTIDNMEDLEQSKNPTNTITGSGTGVEIVNYALQFVGNPYVWGGTSLTNGADCSGFIMTIFSKYGVSLPHSSAAMRGYGIDIGTNLANAKPGDIICYNGHVAIYMGNNKIVHAASAKTGIKISNNAAYRAILTIRRLV
ncbi:MAG: C40 family peptidase [Bacilli bacterium]|nr:C40 family peptidase [Bacilli bacterium]